MNVLNPINFGISAAKPGPLNNKARENLFRKKVAPVTPQKLHPLSFPSLGKWRKCVPGKTVSVNSSVGILINIKIHDVTFSAFKGILRG